MEPKMARVSFHYTRMAVLSACLAFVAVSTAPAAAAVQTVKVTLADHGAAMEMPKGLGMGMQSADPAKAPLSVSIAPNSVKAGKVTFRVANASKDMIHEMIIAPIEDPTKALPYVANEQ